MKKLLKSSVVINMNLVGPMLKFSFFTGARFNTANTDLDHWNHDIDGVPFQEMPLSDP